MQKGNSTLEMILFLPLALFFLFVVIDAGLSLSQRAAISDGFRASIGALPSFAKQGADNQQIAEKISQELDLNIAKVFASYQSGEYQVLTRLYSIQIDPVTGQRLSDYPNLVREFKLGQVSNQKFLRDFKNADLFMEEIIAQDFQTPSKYSEPQGLINNTADASKSGQRYSETSWLLYSEVRAVPVGINSSFLRSALGGLYTVQLQELELLRDY